jgi:fructose-bisphosphate aldolase, class II
VHLQTEKSDGIDFAALRAIEAATALPLVLHGGSGIPPDIRQRLARGSRVSKFNIGTELRMAFGAALRKSLGDHPGSFDRLEILSRTIAPVRAEAAAIIRSLRYPVHLPSGREDRAPGKLRDASIR